MVQQSIGLGTVANDGTGDDLRTAGGKVNANFSELYAADPLKLEKAGGTMTGPLVLAADPSSALHPATKQYVDGLAANLGKRGRVRVATTANVAIATALNSGDVLDGVTLATGDMVLVKDQTAPAENGVYVVGATPARAAEFDTYDEHAGSLVAVQEGTANADTIWLSTSNVGGTLNTTAIAFTRLVTVGELLAANNLSDVANAATAFGNIKQTATTGATGVVELATQAEVDAGTAGLVVTADALKGRPKFVAHKNGVNQTGIPQNAFTKVTFGTETTDVGGYYDPTLSRWTPPAGNYIINSMFYFTGLLDGQEIYIIIFKNGAQLHSCVYRTGGAGAFSATIQRSIVANGTDYYEMYVYNPPATSDKTIDGSSLASFFEGWMI